MESNPDHGWPAEGVTANVSAPKANVPEQLGLSLPAHDRASWRMAGTASASWGVWNSLITTIKALLAKLARLAGPVRWTQSAINAS
ncbi:MAG: hypothetical protein QOI77_1393 [Blastocatellia bacterium]|jgi:hypothetical protein|nr:hypothetical protein [Blastocatellia bacterium]